MKKDELSNHGSKSVLYSSMESKGLPSFRTAYNWSLRETETCKGGGPIVTVPNQGYSLRDLVERVIPSGIDPAIYRIGRYSHSDSEDDFDRPDLEEVSRMDQNDRGSFASELSSRQLDIETELRKMQAQRAADQKVVGASKAVKKPEPSKDVKSKKKAG